MVSEITFADHSGGVPRRESVYNYNFGRLRPDPQLSREALIMEYRLRQGRDVRGRFNEVVTSGKPIREKWRLMRALVAGVWHSLVWPS